MENVFFLWWYLCSIILIALDAYAVYEEKKNKENVFPFIANVILLLQMFLESFIKIEEQKSFWISPVIVLVVRGESAHEWNFWNNSNSKFIEPAIAYLLTSVKLQLHQFK